jgi:SHS2 domain-containing protein
MTVKKKYDFLEHTADVYIASYGESLEEAFENAALAMFDVMTEVKLIEPKAQDQVVLEGSDCFSLLYNWLEALLVLFETKGNLYSRFYLSKIAETNSGLKFEAKIWGEPYDAEKHPQKVAVKAVTYHQMEILKELGIITLKLLLDI